jgi:hypothetical protein
MERNLAQLRDSSGSGQAADFLNLLKRAAPALAAGGKVAALRYDGAVLQVDIEFPSTSNVESARTALTARGLKAELLDSQAREGKVLARLRAGIAGKS